MDPEGFREQIAIDKSQLFNELVRFESKFWWLSEEEWWFRQAQPPDFSQLNHLA